MFVDAKENGGFEIAMLRGKNMQDNKLLT